MKIHDLLAHHGLASNPFAEEDAQTDQVFKEHCISDLYHPAWDKIFGDPAEPATSLVFGEKGAGKTAMRLQMFRRLTEFNRRHPGKAVFVINYDDFNPFLDRFRDTFRGKKHRTDRVLAEWKLWDHMDAILSLGVTSLVDRLLGSTSRVEATDVIDAETARKMDPHQVRDLLLLAAYYDFSLDEQFSRRWARLRHLLRFFAVRSLWDIALGSVVTLGVLAVLLGTRHWTWFFEPWPYVVTALGWVPRLYRMASRHWKARSIVRNVRVGNRETSGLRRALLRFSRAEIGEQPMPNKMRTDDRYELLIKLQSILKSLGFHSIVVLMDRVDEPHLVNGSPDQMRAFLWPMLDNKFLKQPGIGLKMLLPIEVHHFLETEDREFFQRARLDKQNMIPSLQWTGESLYDLANARIAACAERDQSPTLLDLFEDSLGRDRMIEALKSLRVPRHLFKFMHRLLVAHANAYTSDAPNWKISSDRFESVLAVYLSDQDAVDRGVRAG